MGHKWQSTVKDFGETRAEPLWQVDEVKNFQWYIGLDCIKRFARELLEKETENRIKHNKKLMFNFNKEDKIYDAANNTCHICGKTCINMVRDHCHETGKYRGSACQICNLRYKQQKLIPVMFHNVSANAFNLL